MARKALLPPSVKAGIPQDQPVPPGWSKVTYGDVLDVVERPATLEDDAEYQLVTAKRSRGGIVPRERLLGSQVLTKTQFYIRSGDFLISRRQIIHGACGVVPDELDGAIVSNEYATLRNRPSLDIEFMSYLSHSIHFQQCCFHSSVGVDVEKMVFKLDQWLKHSFSLPPLPEQKKIVAILGSLDDAIQAAQAVIDQTRKVKKGLLQQLLIRGIGHTRFKQTEVGEIPESWSLAKIGDTFAVTSGGTPSRDRPEFWGGDIPWVKTGEVAFSVITDTEEKITALGLAGSSAKIVPANSVLIAMYGQGPTRGRVGYLGTEAALNQACLALLPRSDAEMWFVYYFLESQYQNLRNLSNDGSQKNLSAGLIKDYSIPLPTKAEQVKIAGILGSVDNAIREAKTKLQSLQVVKQGLMVDLLSGRIHFEVPA
jgi:type I restriction enzyme S subunit